MLSPWIVAVRQNPTKSVADEDETIILTIRVIREVVHMRMTMMMMMTMMTTMMMMMMTTMTMMRWMTGPTTFLAVTSMGEAFCPL